MTRSVVIAGIGKRHPGIPAYRPGMEVWGINDCYQHCPEIKQYYKIYNIHKDFPECVEDRPKRFKNWRRRYDNSRALIITAKDLGLKKQRILDITKLREDNDDFYFCSSFSYAIFEAVERGYTEIRLYRLSLNHGEYATQGHGIVQNIRWAQAKGVKVIWPWFKEVESRYKRAGADINIFYGEQDINFRYGETNETSVAALETAKAALLEDAKEVKTVPLNLVESDVPMDYGEKAGPQAATTELDAQEDRPHRNDGTVATDFVPNAGQPEAEKVAAEKAAAEKAAAEKAAAEKAEAEKVAAAEKTAAYLKALDTMNRDGLRDECKRLGLKSSGTKPEMKTRITEHAK